MWKEKGCLLLSQRVAKFVLQITLKNRPFTTTSYIPFTESANYTIADSIKNFKVKLNVS